MLKKVVIILIVAAFFAMPVYAHPGGTDVQGCHVCRTDCVERGHITGAKHCHPLVASVVKPIEEAVIKQEPVIEEPVIKQEPLEPSNKWPLVVAGVGTASVLSWIFYAYTKRKS